MRQIFVILGTVTLLAAAGCSGGSSSGGSSDVSQSPSPSTPLAGSSTRSMASVTGSQDLGMYSPYMGTRVYESGTPPPGKAYGR